MDRAARPDSARPAVRTAGAGRLSESEFAAAFNQSFRLFWLIAVGVTRDAALAEDIVQDAAVIALRKLDEFEPGTSFNAWMGQTVRFVAYNASRKEKHRRVSPHDPADMDRSAAATPAATVDVRIGSSRPIAGDQPHFDDHVMHALEGLNDTARSCLLLRTLADLEYSEIARLLGIPEGTAMSHVHRTRKVLRDQLAPHYAGWAGAAGGHA